MIVMATSNSMSVKPPAVAGVSQDGIRRPGRARPEPCAERRNVIPFSSASRRAGEGLESKEVPPPGDLECQTIALQVFAGEWWIHFQLAEVAVKEDSSVIEPLLQALGVFGGVPQFESFGVEDAFGDEIR